MRREMYKEAELDVIAFAAEDVITSSFNEDDEETLG
jgi:hypothetical protein